MSWWERRAKAAMAAEFEALARGEKSLDEVQAALNEVRPTRWEIASERVGNAWRRLTRRATP